MKGDRYISVKKGVDGFSFANLGLFTGFGGGIIDAVYSLILLDIWGAAAIVGIYSSAYFAFGLAVQVFFGEFMRMFSKAKLFYSSVLVTAVCFAMLSFSIKPATFVALDFFTEIPLVFIGTLIPLFMADFAGRGGIAKMNGRYHLWLNAGALFAPMIAVMIANRFGNRSAFFASAVMYLLCWLLFKRYRIVQEDKKIPKLSPRRTLRSVWRGVRAYFRRVEFVRAYVVNFGYYAMKAMRLLYWPILVIENGFSKDTLGLILTIGVIPYVLLSEPVGTLARKYGPRGTKIGLAFGFLLFSACSFAMFFAGGRAMLVLFVLMQVAGAIQESLHDLMFFDVAKKAEQGRFYGIFNTSVNLPKFVTPLVGSAFIVLIGATGAIWIATGFFGILTTFVLLFRGKK
ncbi:MAG: MFS transporter [Rickettsiales bacterium]|jgi:MFS family permease|nr:MFS transporter [Rickettsiales bacterium]